VVSENGGVGMGGEEGRGGLERKTRRRMSRFLKPLAFFRSSVGSTAAPHLGELYPTLDDSLYLDVNAHSHEQIGQRTQNQARSIVMRRDFPIQDQWFRREHVFSPRLFGDPIDKTETAHKPMNQPHSAISIAPTICSSGVSSWLNPL